MYKCSIDVDKYSNYMIDVLYKKYITISLKSISGYSNIYKEKIAEKKIYDYQY